MGLTAYLQKVKTKIKLKDTVDKEDAEKAVRLQMACLKEVGVDPETGEIDIEVMEGRTPTSEREKMQKVMEEIGLLEEEFGNQAPLNVLVSNMAEKFDMSEDKVESIVRNLNQKGLIYIPSTGYLKRA